MTREYLLMVEGCPYVLATAGCPTSGVTRADTGDPGWGTAVILPDLLLYPEGDLEASLSPSDSTLSVSGMTFKINDLPIVSGGTDAGKPFATYYGTRHPSLIASTALTSALTASSTSFAVASASGLAADDVVWVDAEAIVIDAPSGLTVPILGGTAGRGQFGSRAVDHIPSEGRYPEAWKEWPGPQNKRVVLYAVEVPSKVATAVWRGYADAGFDEDEAGSSYILSCKHAWDRVRAQRLGYTSGTCQLFGYDLGGVAVTLHNDSLRSTTVEYLNTYATGPALLKPVNTAQELAAELFSTLRGMLSTRWDSTTNYLRVLVDTPGAKIRVTVRAKGTEVSGLGVGLQIAGQFLGYNAGADDGSGETVAIAEADLPPACRTLYAGHPIEGGVDLGQISVDSLVGLPTAWAPVTTTAHDGAVTYIKPVMRAKYTDDSWLVIEPSSTQADPPVLQDCTVTVRPNGPGAVNTAALGVQAIHNGRDTLGVIYVTAPMTLTVAYRVRADHWIYALRYAIFRDADFASQVVGGGGDLPDYLNAGMREEDWDWSSTQRVVRVTSGIASAREWFLDGTARVGPMLQDLARFSGCAVVVRSSKLTFWPIQPPVPSDTIASEFQADDCARRPTSQVLYGALANAVSVEIQDGQVVVVDARSQERYGQTPEIEIKFAGLDNFAAVSMSAATVAQYLLGRVIGGWSEPVRAWKILLPADAPVTAEMGDYIRVTKSDTLPDGRGARGFALSSTDKAATTRGVAQVISSRRSIQGPATRELLAVVWGLTGFAGFSPCARVTSISGAVLTLSKSYLTAASSTKNYDGSDPSTGDGGARWFKPGYVVLLIERNNTSPHAYSAIVSSVSGNTITLTASVPTSPTDFPNIAAVGMLDVIFDAYSTGGLQPTQKGFAWVGDATTGKVASTSDDATRWSP